MITEPTRVAIAIYGEFPVDFPDSQAWDIAVDAARTITGEEVTYATYEEAVSEVDSE